MADRTFESQQYASQEAVRGEAALSQGIGALAGAATQAGAALERHGDRMAQREQAGAQMAESRRQADQSAVLRREEMGIQREQLDQQGRQFEMTRLHQMADLQFRQQVDARVAANQAADQEVRNLEVQLQWQDSTAARAEAAARWEQDERKLAILSNTRVTKAQVEAAEIQNQIAKTQLKAIEDQQTAENQRGRLSGRTLNDLMKQASAVETLLLKLTDPDAQGGGAERQELIRSAKSRYDTLNQKIDAYLTESEEGSQNPLVGPPPPRRPAPNPVMTPPPVGGVRAMDYDRFNQITEKSMLGAVRSPKSANQSNARIAGMMFRMAKDGNGIELADPVAYQKWKEAASRFWVGTSADGQSEESFVQSFNRQTEVLMQDHGMTLNEALDYMGSIR